MAAEKKKMRPLRRHRLSFFPLIFFLLCFWWALPAFAIDISDTPLDAVVNAPAPNVMLVWDDSSSMQAEFMTNAPDGLFAHCFYLFRPPADQPGQGQINPDQPTLDENQRRLWRSQWWGYNHLYYNPSVEYRPWPATSRYRLAEADLNRPWSEPVQLGAGAPRIDLSETFFQVRNGNHLISIPNAHYFVHRDQNANGTLDPGEPIYLVTWQDANQDGRLEISNQNIADQRLYFRFSDNGDGRVGDNELAPVLSEIEKNAIRPAIHDENRRFVRFKTDREDLQNFANWISYHRRREFAAKSAVAQFIAHAGQKYIGIYALNRAPRLGVQPVHLSPTQPGGAASRPADTSRTTSADGVETLLNALYKSESKGKKPLRTALDQVGKYFDQRSTSSLGASPVLPEKQGGQCQRNYAVIISDGFWNDEFAGVGNADGNWPPPFRDTWPDTLADVAMYYFSHDLAPDLPDLVPANACDTFGHQHMVTHAISFGAHGTLKVDDLDNNGITDNPGYRQDPCFLSSQTPRPIWPQPMAGQPSTVDDLWHAAINGHGLYYYAEDESSLLDALDHLFGLAGTSAAASAMTISGESLSDQTVIYQARYDSREWTGDLLAFSVSAQNSANELNSGNALWSAADQLRRARINPDTRRIVTYGGPWQNPQGIPLRYDALSEQQKQQLRLHAAAGAGSDKEDRDVLDFIRGKEFPQFRQRSVLLGDIVHSAPAVWGDTVFVGANDGMLHAFDAHNGKEKFAYVPGLVFDHLKQLCSTEYINHHRYFVDATPYIGEVLEELYQRKTYLLGGLGKGGKGYYCLQLAGRRRTQSGTSFGAYQSLFSMDDMGQGASEDDFSRLVLWEYPRPDSSKDDMDNDDDGLRDEPDEIDSDMGFSFGQGYVVNANALDGTFRPVAIFGNGYNSPNGHAVLYILDLRTGMPLRKIDTGAAEDNGLSTPALIDVNLDRCVDYVYAGDLKGNLWKFDLRATEPALWGVAYGEDRDGNGIIDASQGDLPRPVFQATGQPITGRPDVMFMANACTPQAPGFMVIFGTGKYLAEADRDDLSPQSIYGLWDYGDDGDDSEYLGSLIDRASGRLSSGLMLSPISVSLQTTQDGRTVRQFGEWKADYGTTPDLEDGDGISKNNDRKNQEANPQQFAGWFFDFPQPPDPAAEPGERVTGPATIRAGSAVIVSFAPLSGPCQCGGASWLYLMNACGQNSPPPQGQESAFLARRFTDRIGDQPLILKDPNHPTQDLILYGDPAGGIYKQAFDGEVWGKVFWRQNSFE
ncbi:MAG: PilC/PilY family type IV pilus protein [Desulfobacteraceae bacterium]|nr:PilC/PilY family type IV pilus protein [Desulfobacteraceae bacterium]